MDDFIIMKTGYNNAINDILPLITDELLKVKILRKQSKYINIKEEYHGKQLKCYDKEHNLGYIIFTDTYGVLGIMIDLNTKNRIEIMPVEINFVLDNIEGKLIKEYSKVEELENDFKKEKES